MKYWWAAFNARPLGMPVPPNWFGLAAVGLLGAFVNPALWLIGAGLELGYLQALSMNKRFRKTVDATAGGGTPASPARHSTRKVLPVPTGPQKM